MNRLQSIEGVVESGEGAPDHTNKPSTDFEIECVLGDAKAKTSGGVLELLGEVATAASLANRQLQAKHPGSEAPLLSEWLYGDEE